jgi:hypothetical protein
VLEKDVERLEREKMSEREKGETSLVAVSELVRGSFFQPDLVTNLSVFRA